MKRSIVAGALFTVAIASWMAACVGDDATSSRAGEAPDGAVAADGAAPGVVSPDGGAGPATDSGGLSDAADAAPACSGAATACGDTCVDLRVSKQHCGRCGHDCLGGECSASECHPILLGTVAAGAASLSDIATDGTDVFVAINDAAGNGGGVFKVPAAGGAVTTVASGSVAVDPANGPGPVTVEWVGYLALGGASVFWGQGLEGTAPYFAIEFPKAGGPARPYLKHNLVGMRPRGMAASADGAHWVAAYYDTVAHNAVGATDSADIYVLPSSTIFGVSQEATFAGEELFWVQSNTLAASLGTVRKALATEPTAPVSVATGQATPTVLTVDSGYVYWCASGIPALRRTPTTGGGAVEDLVGPPNAVDSILADANHVYYAYNDGTESAIGYSPAAPGGSVTKMPGTTGARRIARDSRALYFYDAATGKIWRTALP
jgi:hypothetical protein